MGHPFKNGEVSLKDGSKRMAKKSRKPKDVSEPIPEPAAYKSGSAPSSYLSSEDAEAGRTIRYGMACGAACWTVNTMCSTAVAMAPYMKDVAVGSADRVAYHWSKAKAIGETCRTFKDYYIGKW